MHSSDSNSPLEGKMIA